MEATMAEATNSKTLANLIVNKGGEIELVEDTVYTISSNMVSRRACDIIGPKDKSAVLKIGNKVQWAENIPMMRFNSVNGLTMTVTADVEKNTSTTLQWLASNGVTPVVVGSGEIDTISVFDDTILVGNLFDLGTEFPDYPNPDFGVGFSITIN